LPHVSAILATSVLCSYVKTTAMAEQYLCIPATSAQTRCQFSAGDQLITKIRSHFDKKRIDKLTLLTHNTGS